MRRSEPKIDARSRPGLMEWRRQRVAALRSEGLSRAEIAERLQLTYRQVRHAERQKEAATCS